LLGALNEAIEELERQMIMYALERSGGNLTHAAKRLRLTNKGLRDKLKRLGIEKSALHGNHKMA